MARPVPEQLWFLIVNLSNTHFASFCLIFFFFLDQNATVLSQQNVGRLPAFLWQPQYGGSHESRQSLILHVSLEVVVRRVKSLNGLSVENCEHECKLLHLWLEQSKQPEEHDQAQDYEGQNCGNVTISSLELKNTYRLQRRKKSYIVNSLWKGLEKLLWWAGGLHCRST